MSNIRTANKRHKRAIVATIARHRLAETPAIPTLDLTVGKPAKAAL